MSNILTVDCESSATVTVTSSLVHQCPFRHEIDNGSITITWICDNRTIELHSLATYLQTFADTEISHEEIASVILSYLSSLDSRIRLISVHATFLTAGIGMEIDIFR